MRWFIIYYKDNIDNIKDIFTTEDELEFIHQFNKSKEELKNIYLTEIKVKHFIDYS